jgi:glycosyltransferase involved in cell wall biosynthesis
MERDRSRIAAVIPAYQEEKHVGEVAQRTRAQLENVLVVDDGSTDATAERARSSGVDVVIHPQNRGKGESIKTGLRYWLERGSEWVVLLDADGQHLPEEISRFVDSVASESDAKIFIGSRMGDTSAMPLMRRIVNGYMSGKISRVCGQQIPDTQCGFRMLHRDIIAEVLSGASRFEYETEMLIIASRKGHRVASVPITTVYSDEVSSINPVRDTVRFFKLIRRYRNL